MTRKMIDDAVAKITDEMMKIDDPLAQGIEEHLTEICTDANVAERILDPNKKLSEIHKKIYDEARKQANNGKTVMRSDIVFKMVDDYYGISIGTPPVKRPARTAAKINAMDLL